MIRSAAQTKRSIRWWFTRINKKAFRGKLPVIPVKYGNTDKVVAYTNRYRTRSQEWFTIRLSKKIQFSRSLSLISLAHEMVHVENWRWGHNRKFEKRLVEVVKKAGLVRFL